MTWHSNYDFDHFDIRKLSAWWVPRLLSIDLERNRVITWKEFLTLLNRNPYVFLLRSITLNGTLIHRRHSNSWKSDLPGWIGSEEGHIGLPIHIVWLQKGGTMMPKILPNQWTSSTTIWKKKRSHLAKKKMLFHLHNASVYACVFTWPKFNKLCYELPPHVQPWSDFIPVVWRKVISLRQWNYCWTVCRKTCFIEKVTRT